jgi:DNA adenine methylase
MIFYSPLRYPGGKNRLAKFVALVCKENNINGHYVEPYAGGAAVALFLLLNDYVEQITINDIDRSIYAFWYSVLNNTKDFCRLIEETEINISNWKKFRTIQKDKEKVSLLELGFSTFFLNRTNISGVIDAGVIGGLDQVGDYKMNCRFNKEKLIERIKKIATRKKNIKIYNLDALKLVEKIEKLSKKNDTIFYFDPPYYLKGESLYLNYYKHDDHKDVSERIKKIKGVRWIVSYDDTRAIKKMYSGYRFKKCSLFHTARVAKKGKEILFFSNDLIIPEVANPISTN